MWSFSEIQDARLQVLNRMDVDRRGLYVLYWMQQSQRTEDNHALAYALRIANELRQPLLVVFGLTADYPEANLRHYRFMVEGLQEVDSSLAERGIRMVVRYGNPADVALRAGRQASLIVCDRGYLNHQKAWRRQLAENAGRRVVQVETDAIVPVEAVSAKAEYAARTFRPKIQRQLERYLVPLPEIHPIKPSLTLAQKGVDLQDVDVVLKPLAIDRSVRPVDHFLAGGAVRARERFKIFIEKKIERYSEHRNQPQTDTVSLMSAYLHFGQISPLFLALTVKDSNQISPQERNAFLEELIVRRELAINFVNYTKAYDSFECLPAWARTTLVEHRRDPRKPVYDRMQFEAAATHDPYWNAAMNDMKYSGYLHNYMRMYWGKKILEWSHTPEEAFQTTITLNNKYLLDGRDANSYAGVAWVFGLHDRPWKERPIFGKVRYMSAKGLERKCDIRQYLANAAQRIRATENINNIR